jgi:glyoxylase-like metal-dependent hydrolase (beta-lactamase superfamily II)
MERVTGICSGPIATNTYFYPLSETELLVIDPGGDFLEINAAIENMHKKPKVCVLTHAHPDHVGALRELKTAYPEMLIMAHEKEKHLYGKNSFVTHVQELPDLAPFILKTDVPPLDRELCDGGIICNNWQIIYTPGHSRGSICLYNADEKILFTGDTFFAPGCYGRTDLYGGNESELEVSLKKLFPFLQRAKYIYPGH